MVCSIAIPSGLRAFMPLKKSEVEGVNWGLMMTSLDWAKADTLHEHLKLENSKEEDKATMIEPTLSNRTKWKW